MESFRGNGGKEAEADNGSCLEAAVCKVGIGWLDQLVEAGDPLLKLAADAANKPIVKWWHPPEQDRWTWLDEPVGLRERRQSDVALHQSGRLMSSSE